MSIHDYFIMVIIWEHRVPACAEVKAILEDKVKVIIFLLDQLSDITVEVHQGVSWCIPPWFVHRLETINCRVISPLIKKLTYIIKCPVDIFVVDACVLLCFNIPIADPVCSLVFPMAEVVLVNPNSFISKARVVKSILRIF